MFLMTFNSDARFQAIGTTRKELETALLAFWKEYAKEHGKDPKHAQACLDSGSVRFDCLKLGVVSNTSVPTEHLCCCDADRFPIPRNLIDEQANNTESEEVLRLSLSSLSDIVSSSAQFAIACIKQDKLPEEAFNLVRDEFYEALDAAGVLDISAVEDSETGTW